MRTNEDMRAMAQRQLDGMTVNRDLLAKDVIALLDRNERLQQIVTGLGKRIEALDPKSTQQAQSGQSFTTTFDEIFADIFGRKASRE